MRTVMRTKVLMLGLVLGVGLILGIAGSAHAVPVAPGVWWEFSFTGVGVLAQGCAPADPLGLFCVLGPGAVLVGAPAWTFVAPPEGAELRVTDAFCKGDRFDVRDGVPSIGLTTLVPILPCGALGETDSPVVAFADPTYSKGTFALGPGAHSITIFPTVSPVGAGAAYFRWDPAPRDGVPEPASMLLLGAGLIAVCGARRKLRQRLSS